jgi:hypothetical protein
MDIFVINKDKADSISKELLDKFGYKTLHDKNQKKIHQFSYLMIDRILENFYGIQERELLDNEKPILKSGGKFISLSHSENYIVISFSDSNCWIDIERIKQRKFEKISKRMNFNSKSLKEFYLNWTEYEAVYKLGETPRKIKSFEIPEYIITAVSNNSDEMFEVYYNI